ncbi:hypothetical protein [Sorangium sp. So ce124]|uniref:hypothetical protein n=1 Tax=Sorangium sp. So ce124 TaxID=3133280 RepID=UPI003F6410D9
MLAGIFERRALLAPLMEGATLRSSTTITRDSGFGPGRPPALRAAQNAFSLA